MKLPFIWDREQAEDILALIRQRDDLLAACKGLLLPYQHVDETKIARAHGLAWMLKIRSAREAIARCHPAEKGAA